MLRFFILLFFSLTLISAKRGPDSLADIQQLADLIIQQKGAEACQKFTARQWVLSKRAPDEKGSDGHELSRAYIHAVSAVCGAVRKLPAAENSGRQALTELRAAHKFRKPGEPLVKGIVEIYSLTFYSAKIQNPRECGLLHWYGASNLITRNPETTQEREAIIQIFLMNAIANECEAMRKKANEDSRSNKRAAVEWYQKVLAIDPPEQMRKGITERVEALSR